MARYDTAADFWTRAGTIADNIIDRVERYAALTIPKVCLPDGLDESTVDQSHDYQSIGAQAVNHVVNKLMLALFAPSRPFIKLMAGKDTKAAAAKANLTDVQLNEVLANGEREAVKELDARAQRPKLYQILRHLVVTGNVLLVLGKKSMRVMGLKYFRVKRDVEGEVMTICIREDVEFSELDKAVRTLLSKQFVAETVVAHYRYITRDEHGYYVMRQYINNTLLPKEFNGRWTAEKLPYRVLTWDLADESDYGTGLVEEYIGDLEALSTLSEAVVDGSVLACEARTLVNPTGMTSVEDIKNSVNGDAVAGTPADIASVQLGRADGVQVAQSVSSDYEKRVARGFLMGSAVIRDAERVTQEEVRLTANELETAYGGVYSTLAASLQLPVAGWLFASIGMPLASTDIKITIVTGLDALSRNGDLENFRLAMADLATISTLPETLQIRLKMGDIATFIGQGRGVDMSKFLKSEEEVQAMLQQQAQQRAAEAAATQAGVTAAQPQEGPPAQ
jgi:hypothetical protein